MKHSVAVTAPFATPIQPPFSGTILDGRFRIEKELAIGGFGILYRATDLSNLSEVVVKRMIQPMHLHGFECHAFRREVLANSMLNHPNLIRFISSGHADFGNGSSQYMAQEYFPATNFADFFESGSPVWPTKMDEARIVLLAVAKTLEYIHSMGIIHGDIKPANILVKSYAQDSVRLIDFGLMRFLDQSWNLCIGSITSGSPTYMSPEQFRPYAVADARADVYSLGIIMRDALSHIFWPQSPRTGSIITGAQASPQLNSVVSKATKHELAQRFQTMQEFREAIERYLTPYNVVDVV